MEGFDTATAEAAGAEGAEAALSSAWAQVKLARPARRRRRDRFFMGYKRRRISLGRAKRRGRPIVKRDALCHRRDDGEKQNVPVRSLAHAASLTSTSGSPWAHGPALPS